jgi:hypothetical protein
MKSFKEFLKEAPQSIDVEPDQMHLHDHSIRPAGKFDDEDSYGGDKDYTLLGRSWKSPNTPDEKFPVHHWILHHDDSGIAHMHSRGGTTPDGYFIANDTSKHPDCEISAPEFYKHILRSGRVKGIQSSTQQSEGGKSIWKRLHRDSDVEVTHHDSKTGKQIPLHRDWDRNYDHEQDTHFRVRLKGESK